MALTLAPFHRLVLFLALLLSAALTTFAEDPKPAVKPLTPEQAEKLIQGQKGVVILDVRSPKEHSEGHLKDAVNIDSRSAEFRTELAKLDKSKTYLVHCTRGLKRSTDTVEALKELGFKSVVSLEGGYNAWVKDGKPVSK